MIKGCPSGVGLRRRSAGDMDKKLLVQRQNGGAQSLAVLVKRLALVAHTVLSRLELGGDDAVDAAVLELVQRADHLRQRVLGFDQLGPRNSRRGVVHGHLPLDFLHLSFQSVHERLEFRQLVQGRLARIAVDALTRREHVLEHGVGGGGDSL
ncbi:hypothetical protein H257_08792 [Aphanomyces astaci]|uniref:Uncharacterized protein n=1 Tax=Aphanomyces astaci TaxID=112090 RepID=W4GE60_APHAT|nr:hypothetical protein H257_08792 [Aphanomyces astaci]ETV77354.1 hypothetical protein H257_08792 [Aphanomyces astaci]|eukprot:XP_009833141.1 hypothetical protein H257_08792 [Aphanomyces astaci]